MQAAKIIELANEPLVRHAVLSGQASQAATFFDANPKFVSQVCKSLVAWFRASWGTQQQDWSNLMALRHIFTLPAIQYKVYRSVNLTGRFKLGQSVRYKGKNNRPIDSWSTSQISAKEFGGRYLLVSEVSTAFVVFDRRILKIIQATVPMCRNKTVKSLMHATVEDIADYYASSGGPVGGQNEVIVASGAYKGGMPCKIAYIDPDWSA